LVSAAGGIVLIAILIGICCCCTTKVAKSASNAFPGSGGSYKDSGSSAAVSSEPAHGAINYSAAQPATVVGAYSAVVGPGVQRAETTEEERLRREEAKLPEYEVRFHY